jgi:exodeoxyribonuclease VII small subunit
MPKQKNIHELNYEEAFRELEALVAALEGDNLPLDRSIQMYERGQSLAKRCADLLESAQLHVKQLSGEAEVDFNEAE